MGDYTYTGSEIKLVVRAEPMGELRLQDYDFEIEFYCNKKSVTIHKNECKMEDEDTCICIVDTKDIGTGILKCKITAYIHDSDDIFDGKRTEIAYFNTGIEIRDGL